MKVGGLFDGIGLLAYGLHRAGLEHAWLCEVDPWRRTILNQRFPGVPVFDDVRAVGAHNAEPVHVVAGGFPCKGASTAGKLNGFDHPETVLWREMFRIVGELRPRYVLVENVANLLALHHGAVWGEVLGDLASLGYDTTWDCLPAAAVGAPHLRDRVFAVATHPGGSGWPSEGRRWSMEPEERSVGAHAQALADSGRDGVREQPEPEPGSGRTALSRWSGEAAANADQLEQRQRRRSEASERTAPAGEGEARPHLWDRARGVAVEWGDYAPAVARWEAVHGPAPEPLVRRVDDRGATRVERSRLSALGDGVQVQVGELVGRHIIELEGRRMNALKPKEKP